MQIKKMHVFSCIMYCFFSRLWSGVVPRVMWISIGGFVFLGVYDGAKYYFSKCL